MGLQLKCSGEAGGCSRCRSQHLACAYPHRRKALRSHASSSKEVAGPVTRSGAGNVRASNNENESEGEDVLPQSWEASFETAAPLVSTTGPGADFNVLDELLVNPGDFASNAQDDIFGRDVDTGQSSATHANITPMDINPPKSLLTPPNSSMAGGNAKGTLLKGGRNRQNCSCLNTLACLLGRLTVQTASVEPTATDTLVGVYLSASAEVSRACSCAQCIPRPEVLAVTATVTQHMSNLCELMMEGLLGAGGERFDIAFGSVRIDADPERALLCQAVVYLQFRNLYRLLQMLKRSSSTTPAISKVFHTQATKLASLQQHFDGFLEISDDER
nr:hypothetical protein CFP56_63407 [Quercus suber]POE94748.1 hypothetical protein CFP56_16985 [Quercus suber]